jgi:2-(1,2-epoxy-1,2-dihydrophenyl)acetyl-CoA isomerase
MLEQTDRSAERRTRPSWEGLVKNQSVRLERQGAVARVILNRPDVLNAVNRDLIAGIKEAYEEVSKDDSIRVVIMTGAGRGFSSGGDLKKAPDAAAAARTDPVGSLKDEMAENTRVLSVLELEDKITIAAINGPAVGVGLEIACAADFRLAKASAKMAFTQTVMGMVPMYAFGLLPPMMRLPDIKKIMLLGEFILAPEAHRIGLVDEVYPDEEFDAAVTAYAERMAKVAPQVVWVAKKALNERVIAETHRAINTLEYGEFWLRVQRGHTEGANELRARVGLPPTEVAH